MLQYDANEKSLLRERQQRYGKQGEMRRVHETVTTIKGANVVVEVDIETGNGLLRSSTTACKTYNLTVADTCCIIVAATAILQLLVVLVPPFLPMR